MVLAVLILSVVMLVALYSFNAAVRSWVAGTSYVNGITHADYILEQVAMGLRSAYYPDTGRVEGNYGMTLLDGGDGPNAHDELTWVKIGTAIVGNDADYADVPHRIEIAIKDPGRDSRNSEFGGFAFRAWRVDLQPDDFDTANIGYQIISPRVQGMNFRMLDPQKEEDDLTHELQWLDTWEEPDQTNRLPRAIEVTLYIEGEKPEDDPAIVRRVVSLPLAELSWNPRKQEEGQGDRRGGRGGRQPPPRTQRNRPAAPGADGSRLTTRPGVPGSRPGTQPPTPGNRGGPP